MRRRVRKVRPFGWLRLKTLLLRGLLKFKIFCLKTECEGELQISESNLFHSTNTDGKIELRKKLFLTLNWGITKFCKKCKLFKTVVYFEKILI